MKDKSTWRTLKLGAFALAALVTVLSGCEDPITETTKITIEEKHDLSAPGNPRAAAYPGVIVVAWDLVKDAANYTVTRTDSKGTFKSITTTATTVPYLVDKVGFSNQLTDGETYTYTIKANAGAGSVYNNSQATASATAAIPAWNDADVNPVTVPAEADITVTPIVWNNGDYLEVTWTDAATTVSFADYEVKYLYGAASDELLTASVQDNNASATPLHRVLFPLIGGTPVIKVTGAWADDAYYLPKEVSKTADAVTTSVLPAVGSWNASRRSTGPKTTVDLQWQSVTGATTYNVYRSEKAVTGNTQPQPGDTIAWTAVTSANSTWTENGTTIKALDTNAAVDKNYIYLIVAANASGARSNSPTLANNVVPAVLVNLNTPSVTATVTSIEDKKVTITWTEEEGVTYTLARAVIAYDSNVGRWIAEDYTAIALTAQNSSLADNHRTVLDTLPAYRTSYHYKVTATLDGLTKFNAVSSYASGGGVTSSPFSATSVTVSGLSASQSIETVYAIDVTVQLDSQEYYTDLSAKLFRAEVPASGSVENTTFARVGGTLEFTVATGTYYPTFTYTDSAVTLGSYYVYRVEIYTGTTLLVHGDTVTSKRQPSTAYQMISNYGYSASITPSSDDSVATLTVATGTGSYLKVLKGAKLYLVNASDDYEVLGTIAYATTGTNGAAAVAAIQANSYYVSLDAATLTKVRQVGSSTLYLTTEATNGDQKPQNTSQAASIPAPSVYSLLNGGSASVKYASTQINQSAIEWSTTVSADNTALVGGVTLYYQGDWNSQTGSYEYHALGTVAATGSSAITQSPTVAGISANSYYVILNATANSALNGNGSQQLYVRNYNYTSDDANYAYEYVTNVNF
jgi:hypothetical protein